MLWFTESRMERRKRLVFWLHFNRFGARKGSSDTWTVKSGGKNQHARKVICDVPLETIYKGDSAPQPRAYLKGRGVVRRIAKDIIEISGT